MSRCPMAICFRCLHGFAEPEALAGQMVVCPHCQAQLLPPLAPRPFLQRAAPAASPLLAGVLSLLLPGLGQIVQGRRAEGFCFLAAAIVLLALSLLTAAAAMLGLALLVWSVIDAASQ
jgi:hypothetical protein